MRNTTACVVGLLTHTVVTKSSPPAPKTRPAAGRINSSEVNAAASRGVVHGNRLIKTKAAAKALLMNVLFCSGGGTEPRDAPWSNGWERRPAERTAASHTAHSLPLSQAGFESLPNRKASNGGD